MNHVISRDQVGLLMNCYLVEVMVVERGSGVGWLWSVGLWSLMGLALVIDERSR